MGSTRKVVKLEVKVEETKYTPPSPIKATPTTFASDSNDISTLSVSNAGNVMMNHQAKRSNYLTIIVFYPIKTHLRAKPRP